MSSTSETGHAKNVANFQSLLEFLKSYGSNYNPTKNTLKIPQLETLYADAQAGINKVTTKYAVYNNTANSRQIAFANLKPLATRLINALQSTDASELVVKDAKNANRKLQGKRAASSTVASPIPLHMPAPNTISVSQQSYTNQLQHFAAILAVLENEPNYTPNETELNIASIQDLKNQLNNLNNQVASEFAAVSNARVERNTALYNTDNGICAIALEIKQYIKSLFGSQSPQYAQIKGIQFKPIKY